MRAPLLTGMGIGCTAIIGAWVIAQLMPLPVKPVQTEPDPQRPAEKIAATPSRNNNPSIDQQMLERAYAPLTESLPPEAMPVASPIHPPEQEWKRLQRQYDAVAN